MHIPDGFLSLPVLIVLWLVTLIVLGYALRRLGSELKERQTPLMGVLAATIFAAQMLNFSVTGGTSGHLMGAALATILLGPWPAVIVMATVVIIQALIFQDGGLLALGGNLFNMAIVAVWVAYFAFTSLRRVLSGQKGLLASGFVAAWLSIFIAALATGLELALSGTSPANIAIPAMGLIHALIGIGEGLITIGALTFIQIVRPDLLEEKKVEKRVWIGGVALATILVLFAPLASTHPDGLEWVAEQYGFLNAARPPLYSLIPDYVIAGIENENLSTILAGLLGVLLAFFVTLSIARARR
uniref:Cobalt/nickel transport system permease protein n=1 Tax=uncultured prokaryote TaxID=198431 RepID=H5SM07_9ZZZZ|nr:cobalt/nickel transport system permease protein [uncultured prokaryote]